MAENARLKRKIKRLESENERLRRALDEARRIRKAQTTFAPPVFETSPTISSATYKQLDGNPGLAGVILISALFDRLAELRKRGEPLEQDCLKNLMFGWIYAQRSLTRKDAKTLLRLPLEILARAMILWWSGKPGPPVSLRHAAIMALIRRKYLNELWTHTTIRVCPCGEQPHGTAKALRECNENLQVEVRILKRLLRECKIELPQKLVLG